MKSLLFGLALLLAGCGESGGDGKSNIEGDGGSGSTASELEPCELLTEADATALFGEPAERDDETPVTDPAYLGACVWTYDTADGLGNQNVMLLAWQGTDYYAPRDEAEPFDIGDEGSLYESDSSGVDVDWIQDGKALTVSYFTVGTGVPQATEKSAEVQALALEVSGRLAAP